MSLPLPEQQPTPDPHPSGYPCPVCERGMDMLYRKPEHVTAICHSCKVSFAIPALTWDAQQKPK